MAILRCVIYLCIVLTEAEGDTPHHITVQACGRIFSVEMLDDNGEIISPATLLEHLQYIEAQCKQKGNGPAVGALTSMNRNRVYEVNSQT